METTTLYKVDSYCMGQQYEIRSMEATEGRQAMLKNHGWRRTKLEAKRAEVDRIFTEAGVMISKVWNA